MGFFFSLGKSVFDPKQIVYKADTKKGLSSKGRRDPCVISLLAALLPSHVLMGDMSFTSTCNESS